VYELLLDGKSTKKTLVKYLLFVAFSIIFLKKIKDLPQDISIGTEVGKERMYSSLKLE
jgi:hypothetical protein